MIEPPVMVSTKDVMHISDILNVTYSLIKKFKHYDNEISDEKIKQLVISTTTELTNQYSTLLEVLNNGQ